MNELDELYQEMILEHSRSPRNFGKPARCDRHAEGYNPLCGDHFSVFVDLEGDRIGQVRFDGSGCAISTSSASLMTEALKGRTVAEADALFERMHALVTGHEDPAEAGAPPGQIEWPELGKLEAFGGVQNFPLRVKCATLAWHTLKAALHEPGASVSTE